MYICICNAVSDSVIRAAVDEGVDNFRELSFRTGCGTQCGSCVPQAREVMDERLAETGAGVAETRLQVVAARAR